MSALSRYRAWRRIPAEDRINGKRVPRRMALRHATGWRIFYLREKEKPK